MHQRRWHTCTRLRRAPAAERAYEYANEVRAAVRGAGMFCDVDLADRKMQKKVREAQLAQYNYILVRKKGGGACVGRVC